MKQGKGGSAAVLIDFWNFAIITRECYEVGLRSSPYGNVSRLNWTSLPTIVLSEYRNQTGKDLTVEPENVRFYGGLHAGDLKLREYLNRLSDRHGYAILTSERATRDRTCPKCHGEFSVTVEKGVDVEIGLDLISGNYRTVFLLSADTDLLPAVRRAKTNGRRVIYVGPRERYGAFTEHCYTAIFTETILSRIVRIVPQIAAL